MAAPSNTIIAGRHVRGCFFLPISSPRIEWSPFWFEDPTDIFTVAPAGNGRVLAALTAPRVEIVQIGIDRSRRPFFSGADGYRVLSMVVDNAGNVRVLAGQGINRVILSISPGGALGPIYALDTLFTSESGFDLAADQCTLFVQSGGIVRRFDVCSGVFLPDFVSASATDLAVLPNGDVLLLVADELRRYDSGGALASTIGLSDFGNALGLHDGGHAALVGIGCDSGTLVDVNLDTGSIVDAGTTDVTQERAILPAGGWTAALGATAAADVPSLSTAIALGLAIVLALVAIRRLA